MAKKRQRGYTTGPRCCLRLCTRSTNKGYALPHVLLWRACSSFASTESKRGAETANHQYYKNYAVKARHSSTAPRGKEATNLSRQRSFKRVLAETRMELQDQTDGPRKKFPTSRWLSGPCWRNVFSNGPPAERFHGCGHTLEWCAYQRIPLTRTAKR